MDAAMTPLSICAWAESSASEESVMDDHPIPGQEYASRLIRFKARQLARRSGMPGLDASDLEQELWVDLISRMSRYDAGKASAPTFIARVVEHKVASILRYQLAEMRSPDRNEASLNEPVLDGDGQVVQRHQTTPEVASDTGHLGELERDLAKVLSGLSDELRAIALGLATGTPHGVAAELGISRRAMTKGIEQLRDAFRDAGLDQYL